MNQKEQLEVVIKKDINDTVSFVRTPYTRAYKDSYKEILANFHNIFDKIEGQSQSESIISFKKRLIRLRNKELKLPFNPSEEVDFEETMDKIIEAEVDKRFHDFCEMVSYQINREIQDRVILEEIEELMERNVPANTPSNLEYIGETGPCSGDFLNDYRIRRAFNI